MLDIKRVLKAAKVPERGEFIQLTSPWSQTIDNEPILGEHPRPTMVRNNYTMLNGWWDYAICSCPEALETLQAHTDSYDALLELLAHQAVPAFSESKIRVPFSPETMLSGVEHVLQPNELLWYRRAIELPKSRDDERILLHFEAIDWACALFINKTFVATHIGGYLPFDIDITGCAASAETIEVALCVFDPTNEGVQPRGKQSLTPGGIWYTPQSGIWQSVWLEVVPTLHLTSLALIGSMEGSVQIEADVCGVNAPAEAMLELELFDTSGTSVLHETIPVKTQTVTTQCMLDHPHLWSPDTPYLYQAVLTLCSGSSYDSIKSYCAFRSVEVKPDAAGKSRFYLNGVPYFFKGVLDQGYWPDSLMTAPTDDALIFDIETCKAAGFNMLRKHIKVESRRWYYHCDRLGMLVWQDAVQGGSPYSTWYTSHCPTLFRFTWNKVADNTDRGRKNLSGDDVRYQTEWMQTCLGMIKLLKSHPSIVTWTLFNEGWGQFDAARAVEAVRKLDPTRPIDATSGWYNQNCGDYHSVHDYFRPLTVYPHYWGESKAHAFILSEFGGLTYAVPGHVFSEAVYGYDDYTTNRAWQEALKKCLDTAEALKDKGSAGYVYSQVSDIEDELNGLLTFDRQVNKLTM